MVLQRPMYNKVMLVTHLKAMTTAFMKPVMILRRGSRHGSDEQGLIGGLRMLHVRQWHAALRMR